jgi:hypothetical protein
MTNEQELRAKALEITAILLAGSGNDYLKQLETNPEYNGPDYWTNLFAFAMNVEEMLKETS